MRSREAVVIAQLLVRERSSTSIHLSPAYRCSSTMAAATVSQSTARSEACSPRRSSAIRTARAGASGEYLVCLLIAPFSELKPLAPESVRCSSNSDS